MRNRLFGVLALLLLIALPVAAADRVVQNGIDLWYTPGDGRTYIDFATIPLPAGFFCFKSAPFTGRIVFRGIPVATGEAGALGRTDTIVQRLDEAVFDKQGVAKTRIQVRALHFESVQAIETACGAFKVEVRLNGEQPITDMRIVRENAKGGSFFAPIAVNGKLVFTPVEGNSSEILEINRNVRFPADQGISWADRFPAKRGIQRSGFVQVDTDNDRLPDTYLPGTSLNFAAGAAIRPGRDGKGRQMKVDAAVQQQDYILDENGCHISPPTEGHCPEVP
jgi:hypothetical protein